MPVPWSALGHALVLAPRRFRRRHGRDHRRVPLKEAEQVAIAALRARGEELLNHNAAIDTNAARREYMAEWRRRNPGYMATKSAEHRERRRQRAADAAAGGTTPLSAFASP